MENCERYILSIDQSTASTKILLFNSHAELVNRVSFPHKQYYPHQGFVEHDPEEIFENTLKGIREIKRITKTDMSMIACLALTNQRETVLIWDRNNGKPVANAAVWQCQRSKEICSDLLKQGLGPVIREKTGLIIDPYFSASKLQWIMNNNPGLKEKALKGDLLLGTIDTWLIWKLTGGKVHVTDHSNASRTMLYNINNLQWDEDLIKLFGLHISMFPEIRFSDEIVGLTETFRGFDMHLPIAGLIGDSHGALFGQLCLNPGMTKATYGTGSSVMMNIGRSPLEAPEGLVTSVGFGSNNLVDYVFEGNIHCTGDTINWLVNELKLLASSGEAEETALGVKDNGGVYFVPAFVGLGAPYWKNEARACISGISRNTTRNHIVRAALESIAYQIKDLIDLMSEHSGTGLIELRVDGGPTRNEFLMQFQSDMLKKKVVRTGIEEISALGSAFMAGLATGIWRDISELKELRVVDKVFQNKIPVEETERLYGGWKKAVTRTLIE